MDDDTRWFGLLVFVVLVAAATIGCLMFAPKNVDYYYISTTQSGDRGMGFCAYAHWTWHLDEIAYCTGDKESLLDFVTRANATLPHGGTHANR